MEKIKINLEVDYTDKEFKKMKDEIFLDKELLISLKKSNVTDAILNKYLAKVYSYKQDKDYCANCPGAANCKKENPLLSSELFFDGKHIEQKYSPCKEILKDVAVANNYIFNDMAKNIYNAEITKLDFTTARSKALTNYINYTNGKEIKWLYLHGAIHSGRSYLAAAIANDVALNGGKTICFIDTPFRFKELYDKSFNDLTAYAAMLEKLKTCDVLVLDDFGNEIKNDYIRDGILSLILSSRMDKKLLTIFTSDYSIDEIEVLYSTSKAGAIRAKQIKNMLNANSEEILIGNLTIY